MGHRASVYSVCVHKKRRSESVPLGDIDEAGHALADFLFDVFDKKFVSTNDNNKEVRVEKRTLTGADQSDLRVVFNPGESGMKANIVDENNQTAFEQEPSHTHVVRSGSLFHLGREDEIGWWVCHSNNGRSVKSLVANGVRQRFKDEFPDLVLKINPCVNAAAFEEALDNDRLLSADLYKYDRAADIADRNKWVGEDAGLKLHLAIKPEGAKGRLRAGLVKKAFHGDRAALGRLIEFQGMPFDKATFEVEFKDGVKRSFNVDALDQGHAFSEIIFPQPESDPTEASLFKELERVLSDLG